MNLKSIVNILQQTSFWRFENFSDNNIYDEYAQDILFNHGAILDERGSENLNLSSKSANLKGGYIESNDLELTNDLISSQKLIISFQFKAPEEIIGQHPIVSKWFPENQYFIGFENGNLVAKIQTQTILYEVIVSEQYIIYNNRWNSVQFTIDGAGVYLTLNGTNSKSLTMADNTIIGTSSPFRLGGTGAYEFNQDLFITDLFIAEHRDYIAAGVYGLTRASLEKNLDLAPDYFFDLTEARQQGESRAKNLGTKRTDQGDDIYAYFLGAPLTSFTLLNNSDYNPKQSVFVPNGGYVSIDDVIQANLTGNRTFNVILPLSHSGFTSSRSEKTLYFYELNNSVAPKWGHKMRMYTYYSSPRIYNYTYDENGTSLQSGYVGMTSANVWTNKMYFHWRTSIGSDGTNRIEGCIDGDKDTTYAWTPTAFVSTFNPPADHTYDMNKFAYNANNYQSAHYNGAISTLFVSTNKNISSYRTNFLQSSDYRLQVDIFYNSTNKKFSSKSCMSTKEDSIARAYVNSSHQWDYQGSYTQTYKTDGLSNRLNHYYGTARMTEGQYFNQYQLTYAFNGTSPFILSMFLFNENSQSSYKVCYSFYSPSTHMFNMYMNMRDGQFSYGDIEVRIGGNSWVFSTNSQKVKNDGYHMVAVTRVNNVWEIWIDGIKETSWISPYIYSFGTYNALRIQNNGAVGDGYLYVNDAFVYTEYSSDDTWLRYKIPEIIEYLFKGYGSRVSGTTYLDGNPIPSQINTIDSSSLDRIDSVLSSNNGVFNISLAKTWGTVGRYLMALPIDKTATANVVVHGPYATSTTYDNYMAEPFVSEIADIILDMEPETYLKMDDASLPLIDYAVDPFNVTTTNGTNFTYNQDAFESNSKSIHIEGGSSFNLDSGTINRYQNYPNGITFMCWFKKNSDQSWVSLFELRGTSITHRIALTYNNNTTWYIYRGDGQGATTKSQTVHNGHWNHIALRIKPDNTGELLLNGYYTHTFTHTGIQNLERQISTLGEPDDANISQAVTYDYIVSDEDILKQVYRGVGINAITLKSNILSDDPQAYYTFDRLKTVQDEMGNYDLTVSGTVIYNKNSLVVNHDIIGNNYLYNDVYKLNPVDGRASIEFNYKTSGTHTQSIVVSEWSNQVGEGTYKFTLIADGVLRVYIVTDLVFLESGILFDDSKFHHVVLNIDGNIYTLYVDNVLQDSVTLTAYDPGTPTIPEVPGGEVTDQMGYAEYVQFLQPITYWRLGEKQGSVYAADLMNNHILAYASAKMERVGLLTNDDNKAVQLNGSSESLVKTTFNETPDTMTLSLLFKTNDISQIGFIFSQGDEYREVHTTSTNLRVVNNNVDDVWDFENLNIQLNKVYHLVIEYNAGTPKLFLDGVEKTATVADAGVITISTTQGLFFGKRGFDDTYFFNGIIDEPSIFSRSLTDLEITTLYNKSKSNEVQDNPTYANEIYKLNPYGYWRLGDESGTVAIDEMKNNHGTYVGSPELNQSGLLINDDSTSALFDGLTNYVSALDHIPAVSTISVSCLINITHLPLTGSAFIFGDINAGGSNVNSRVALGITSAGYWYVSTGDGSSFYYDISSHLHNLIAGKVYHIAYVMNGTNIKIYVDGQMVAEYTSTVSLGTVGAYDWAIGKWGEYGFRLNGTIDEVAIFESELTQAQITVLYNKSKNIEVYDTSTYEARILELRPEGYYRLGEASGSFAIDETGNQDGSFIGTPTFEETGLLVNDADTSIRFDVGDGFYVTNNALYDTNEIVYSFLLKIVQLPIVNPAFLIGISDYNDTSTDKNCYLTTDGHIGFYTFPGSQKNILSNGVYAVGDVLHIVCTTNTVSTKLYINGELQDDIIPGGSFTDYVSASLSVNKIIHVGTVYEETINIIDEVAIFKSIDDSQIIDLYKRSKCYQNTGSSKFANAVIYKNPIAYWRMADDEGTVCKDEMGLFTGAYANTPTLQSQPLILNDNSKSVTYNNSNLEHVDLTPTTEPEKLTYPVSVCCLVNIDSSRTSGIGTLIELDGMFGGKRLDVDYSTKQINIYSAFEADIKTTIPFDETIFISAIWDVPNAKRYMYINGSKVNEGALSTPASKYGGFNLAGHQTNSYYLKGKMSDVSLFDYALNQEDITELYKLSLGIDYNTLPTPGTYSNTMISLTPLSYWRLGEIAGTVAVDEMGNTNGTYINAPTLGVAGLLVDDIDTSITCDGVSQSVNTNITSLSTPNGVSVSMLIKINSLSTALKPHISILSSRGSSNDHGIFLYLSHSSETITGKMAFRPHINTVSGLRSFDSVFIPVIGETYHITITLSNDNLLLYVNGNLDENTALGGISISTVDPLLIGACKTEPNFDGTIDEVAIFDKTLTQYEVNELFYKATGQYSFSDSPYAKLIQDKSPLAYYRLGHSGSIIYGDINTENGLAINDPLIADGLIQTDNNPALVFDNSAYIKIDGISSKLTAIDTMTFSCMFKTIAAQTDDWENMLFSINTSAGAGNVVRIGTSNAGGIYINTTANMTIGSGYNDDQPHHLVVTFDDNDTGNVYIDGALVGAHTAVTPVFSTSALASIGQEWDGGSASDAFDGSISDVSLFSNILPLSEISELYESTRLRSFDITIDSTKISEDLYDFPLLVNLGSTSGTGDQDTSDIFDYYTTSNYTELKITHQTPVRVNTIEADDTFEGVNGSVPNEQRWGRYKSFDLPFISNNNLTFVHDREHQGTNIGIESKFELIGDFDIEVKSDYSNSQMEDASVFYMAIDQDGTANGINQLQVYDRRFAGGQQHGQIVKFIDGTATTLRADGNYATDISGIRIVRTGTSFQVFYWTGSVWTSYATYAIPELSGNMRVIIRAWSGSNIFYTNEITASDFVVNYGSVSWINSTDRSVNSSVCLTEIDRWDQGNSQAQLWAKIPYVSKDVDTVITLSYEDGNTDNSTNIGVTGTFPAQSVWTEYDAVYHLSSDGADSTVNGLDGTLKNMDGTNIVDFGIGKGLSFNGTDEWIDIGATTGFDLLATEDMTIEHVIELDGTVSDSVRGLQNRGSGSGGDDEGWQYSISNTTNKLNNSIIDKGDGSYNNITDSFAVVDDTLTGTILTWDNSTGGFSTYKDGVLESHTENIVGDMTDITITSQRNVTIGCSWTDVSTQSQFMKGKLKEVRFSKEIKSDSWIAANNDSMLDDLVIYSVDTYILPNYQVGTPEIPGTPPSGTGFNTFDQYRMTIGTDSTSDTNGKLADKTWVDDLAFYGKVLSNVRIDEHYDNFVNKKEYLTGDL